MATAAWVASFSPSSSAEGALAQPFLNWILYLMHRRLEDYETCKTSAGEENGKPRCAYTPGRNREHRRRPRHHRCLLALFGTGRDCIEVLGQSAGSTLAVYERRRAKPILGIDQLTEVPGLSSPP